MSAIESARRVLKKEAEAIGALSESLGPSFERAVEILAACRGKVILTGMGKSGLICRKIAATFSSTGTPAFFLHPAEGAHGDLGVLSHGDVVVAMSNSGETAELLGLLPLIRRMDLRLISITGRVESTLARRADVILPVVVADEACPLNLAPMSSTTASLALGDALAAVLMEKRGVSEEDFALVHPAGSLGRKLTLRVEDLMLDAASVPKTASTGAMREAIMEMTSKKLGFTGVFDEGGVLLGIVTDGDLRRLLQAGGDFLDRPVESVMTRNPKTVDKTTLAVDALRLMEDHSITGLFVVDGAGDGLVCGVVHIHHLVRAGLQ